MNNKKGQGLSEVLDVNGDTITIENESGQYKVNIDQIYEIQGGN